MSALFLDQLRPQALEVDVPGHGGRVEVEVLDDVAQREAEGDGQDGPFGVGDDAGARFNRKHFGLNFWFKSTFMSRTCSGAQAHQSSEDGS